MFYYIKPINQWRYYIVATIEHFENRYIIIIQSTSWAVSFGYTKKQLTKLITALNILKNTWWENTLLSHLQYMHTYNIAAFVAPDYVPWLFENRM